MNKLSSAILDIFFPSNCCVCSEPVSISEGYICNECRSKLLFCENSCRICGSKVNGSNCDFCDGRTLYFDRQIPIFEYNDHLQKIIYSLKYKKLQRIASTLGDIAASYIQENPDLASYCENAVIVPVPMDKGKKARRGFNQSEVIASSIAKAGKYSLKKILVEKKQVMIQKEMTYEDRFLNTLGRYSIRNISQVTGLNILLIDDIFTTGATINECARILKKYGALNVFSLTIGRANIKRLEKLTRL